MRNPQTVLLCVLKEADSLQCTDQAAEASDWLRQTPDAVLVFNQMADQLGLSDAIDRPQGLRSIEIFQDTASVFGLRGWHLQGKLQVPIELEYFDG